MNNLSILFILFILTSKITLSSNVIGEACKNNGLTGILSQCQNIEQSPFNQNVYSNIDNVKSRWYRLHQLLLKGILIQVKLIIFCKEKEPKECLIQKNKYFSNGLCLLKDTLTIAKQIFKKRFISATQKTQLCTKVRNKFYLGDFIFSSGGLISDSSADAEISAMYFIFSKELSQCLSAEIKNIRCEDVRGIQLILSSSDSPCVSCDNFLKIVSGNDICRNKLAIFLKASNQYPPERGGAENFEAKKIYRYSNGDRAEMRENK